MELIKGHFSASDAETIIGKMVEVKISFLEEKIKSPHSSEEDIKMREKRIIELQNDWAQLRKQIRNSENGINVNAAFLVGDEVLMN